MKKIGLYFGTFNPIHRGHLILGNYFVDHTDLDEVWFVVTPQNPFKQNDELLEDHHRLKMVQLAIENIPKLKVSNVEFSLPQPNYTIDTLTYLLRNKPDLYFVLLMGEDNLAQFDQWKGYEQILEQVELYVYPRNHQLALSEKLLSHDKIKLIQAPKLDFASERIRKFLQSGISVESLMPPVSWDYLEEMGFYKQPNQ
ncbi:MAG: nicotinate (nicotinamide) nucleotide adenylyltransferase [Flavobacteriaceae bacterium]